MNRKIESFSLDECIGSTQPLWSSWEAAFLPLCFVADRQLRNLTIPEANTKFNPSNDIEVAELLRRLMTPNLHICGTGRPLKRSVS